MEEAPADKKIGVIKVVREITGLGLKEAKDMLKAAPKVLKETAQKQKQKRLLRKSLLLAEK